VYFCIFAIKNVEKTSVTYELFATSNKSRYLNFDAMTEK